VDADLHDIAWRYLRRRCGGEEDWQSTVLNSIHPKIGTRLNLRLDELPLLSAFISPTSWYAFTSRRLVSDFGGSVDELDLRVGISRSDFGNFKGTGENFDLPLATERTATATVWSLLDGKHLQFQYETGRASMANRMRNISVKGVLSGIALGLLLDLLSGVTLTFALGSNAFAPGVTEAEVQKALAEISHASSFLFASLVLGSLSTVAAGYVSARIAKRLPYMNAAAVGAVGLVLGAFLADGTLPLWFNLLGFASVLPMALVGGHLAKRRLRADA
jgi:hypothetical protein